MVEGHDHVPGVRARGFDTRVERMNARRQTNGMRDVKRNGRRPNGRNGRRQNGMRDVKRPDSAGLVPIGPFSRTEWPDSAALVLTTRL